MEKKMKHKLKRKEKKLDSRAPLDVDLERMSLIFVKEMKKRRKKEKKLASRAPLDVDLESMSLILVDTCCGSV